MCRFALYLGPELVLSRLVTEPVNSIIHQSFDSKEREEPLNGDGFGVAWYAPEIRPAPGIFKDLTPAWSNPNLGSLAASIKSRAILAHVRAATPGLPVVRANCHPFARGPFAFMHNGSVAGFRPCRRKLLARLSDQAFNELEGSTDSEYVFALFTDHYRRLAAEIGLEEGAAGSPMARTAAMAEALVSAIAELESIVRSNGADAPSWLNFALTDGRSAVVTRYVDRPGVTPHSLYLRHGERYHVDAEGIGRMVEAKEKRAAVLVASEPLTSNGDWEKIPPNTLLLIHEDLEIEMRPLEPPDMNPAKMGRHDVAIRHGSPHDDLRGK